MTKSKSKMTRKELVGFQAKLLKADSSILENPVKKFNDRGAVIEQIIFLLSKEDEKVAVGKIKTLVAFSKGGKITVKAKNNPKQKGTRSRERFELYKKYRTVQSYIAHGGTPADLTWDLKHKFISLTP